jgi:hypothetical protein
MRLFGSAGSALAERPASMQPQKPLSEAAADQTALRYRLLCPHGV